MEATVVLQPLTEIRLADAERVGRKAAVLGELLRAGFPVPGGYAIPADTFESSDWHLPDSMVASLAGVVRAIDGALAVRSSSVAEDTAGASYAGQYESILDVIGTAELVEAVRTCLVSAHASRVAVYQQATGDSGGRMSVLIQRMVDADAAGVAFTANPVTGDRDEVVVNAVRGLGDRLVSGESTADQWSVRHGQAMVVRDVEQSITAAQAVAVAELARRVERRFGSPQDIEWAIEDGAVWLLQARPITALPEPPAGQRPIPAHVPPGLWQRSNYAPEPLSPMFSSLMLPGLQALTKNLFPYSIGERIEFREIGGWLYSRFVKADKPARIKEKLGQAGAAVEADAPTAFYREWFEVTEPRLTAWLADLRNVDVVGLTDIELLGHLDAVHDAWRDSLTAHFRCGGSGTFVLGQLGVTCRDLLGWDAPQALTLLLGLGGKTTEPAYRLAELVDMVRQRSNVAKFVYEATDADSDTEFWARLREIDAECHAAFAAYQEEYCHRTLGMDIVEPTLAERPALIRNLVRGQLVRGFNPGADRESLAEERASAEATARDKLAGSPEALARFERVLAMAQWAHPGRDDSHYLTQLAGGLLRRAVLEVGARLARRSHVAARDDVFLLRHDEARAALIYHVDRRVLVRERAAERAWATANRGPDTYGSADTAGGPPADFPATVPPQVRHLIDIGMWAWQEVSGGRAAATTPSNRESRVLFGIAGSRGKHTGRVRVITNEQEFDRLKPGDVLVCPETDPQWAVLFPSVGALVTDHGGLLSHPAIIAREYRVPAVLATATATTRLRDGQIVTVDGDNGVVEIVVP